MLTDHKRTDTHEPDWGLVCDIEERPADWLCPEIVVIVFACSAFALFVLCASTTIIDSLTHSILHALVI